MCVYVICKPTCTKWPQWWLVPPKPLQCPLHSASTHQPLFFSFHSMKIRQTPQLRWGELSVSSWVYHMMEIRWVCWVSTQQLCSMQVSPCFIFVMLSHAVWWFGPHKKIAGRSWRFVTLLPLLHIISDAWHPWYFAGKSIFVVSRSHAFRM